LLKINTFAVEKNIKAEKPYLRGQAAETEEPIVQSIILSNASDKY